MAYSSNHGCHHPTVVLSYPEHELVCTHCGQVTDKDYFDQTQVVDEVINGEVQIFLNDLMSNLHIPLGILDLTFFKYQSLRRDERLTIFNNTTVATFALFDVLNAEGVLKSEHELCHYAGIDPHKFWRIQRILNYDPQPPSASLVDQIGRALEFPFFLNEEVLCLVERFKKQCYCKLATIVACAFYNVVLEHRLDISLKRIAQSANVSKSTILTLYKKNRNNCI